MIDPGFWQGRRVLVTGHTGFKGAWTCLLLRALGAATAGYSLPPPTRPSLYELADVHAVVDHSIEGDVRDGAAVAEAFGRVRPEVVLHYAAQSVVLDSYAEPVTTFATNVMGTVHVLEAARACGHAVAIVNVTTDKVYRNQGWPWGYRETDVLGGDDPYSGSKACAELVAEAYRASFFQPGAQASAVALATARAGNVVGGGDWTPHQLVPAVARAFAEGREVELRHPDAVRPWQHVLDCVDGYLTLAQALVRTPERAAQAWNFGPPPHERFTVADVVGHLAQHWGIAVGWRRAAGSLAKEAGELRLDSSKAAQQLGWSPRLATAEALAWVAEWYRETARGTAPREATQDQIRRYLARPPRRGGDAAGGTNRSDRATGAA